MILLDTNVVSEPLRPAPDTRVIEWIDAQPLETLFLSSIPVAELRAGVALLPAGKRRTRLRESLEKWVLPLFAGRALPFDLGCTPAYAELMA
jgi:predicted nucleic acid-binding protein